jgi:hypothetical protein
MSDGKNISLSNGGFYTREEAIDVLKEYTRDPTSFTPVESVFERSKCGNIRLNGKRWRLTYKGFHIGYFDTQKEAQEAFERYLKDPENFTKPKKRTGCVYKKCNRWILEYKKRRLGSYPTQEEAEEARKTLQKSS